MTKFCLLVETLASFLGGNDKTKKDRGVESYTKVFKKAKDYENDLKKFVDKKYIGL